MCFKDFFLSLLGLKDSRASSYDSSTNTNISSSPITSRCPSTSNTTTASTTTTNWPYAPWPPVHIPDITKRSTPIPIPGTHEEPGPEPELLHGLSHCPGMCSCAIPQYYPEGLEPGPERFPTGWANAKPYAEVLGPDKWAWLHDIRGRIDDDGAETLLSEVVATRREAEPEQADEALLDATARLASEMAEMVLAEEPEETSPGAFGMASEGIEPIPGDFTLFGENETDDEIAQQQAQIAAATQAHWRLVVAPVAVVMAPEMPPEQQQPPPARPSPPPLPPRPRPRIVDDWVTAEIPERKRRGRRRRRGRAQVHRPRR